MLNIRIHKNLAPLAAAAALVLAAPAQAAGFTSLTVFGDSLSDSGNNFAIGLFDPAQVVTGNSYVPSNTFLPAGTYSNGPVWATTFAGLLGIPLLPSFAGGTNFASGGATTGTNGGFALPAPPFPPGLTYPYSLATQSALYLAATGGLADPTGLYVVAGGGNNARAALEDPNLFVDFGGVVTSYAAAFASNIGNIVDNLQAAGAQNIVVWNVPNLSLAPAVAAQGPLAVAASEVIVDFMNAFLGAELAGEAGVEIFDIHGLLDGPAAGAFANTTDACGAAAIGTDCSTYAFWDGIHPTAAAHNIIAGQMIAAVPEPETYALMALGLVAVGFAARRRKALQA